MEYYYVLEMQAEAVEELLNDDGELERVCMSTDTFVLQPVSQNKAAFLDLLSNRFWFRLCINGLPINTTSEYKEKQLLFHFSFNATARVEEKNGDFYLGVLLEDKIEMLIEALTHTLNDFGYV